MSAPGCSPDIALGAAAGRCRLCDEFIVSLRPRFRVDRPEPCLLPEQQTARLAAAVGLPVTAVLEMNAVRELEAAEAAGRIVGLVRACRSPRRR